MAVSFLTEKRLLTKEIKIKVLTGYFDYDISSLDLNDDIIVFLLDSNNGIYVPLYEGVDYTWSDITKLITFLEGSVAFENFVIIKDSSEEKNQISSFLSEDALLNDTKNEVENIYKLLNELHDMIRLRLPVIESSVHKDMLLPALPIGHTWYFDGDTINTKLASDSLTFENAINDGIYSLQVTINNYVGYTKEEIDNLFESIPSTLIYTQDGTYPRGGLLTEQTALEAMTIYVDENGIDYLNVYAIAWDFSGIALAEPDMVAVTWERNYNKLSELETAIGSIEPGEGLSSAGSSLTTNGYMWIGNLLVQWGISSTVNGAGQNFPIPFPNDVFVIFGNPNDDQTFYTIYPTSLTQYIKYTRTYSGGTFPNSLTTVSWIALGK